MLRCQRYVAYFILTTYPNHTDYLIKPYSGVSASYFRMIFPILTTHPNRTDYLVKPYSGVSASYFRMKFTILTTHPNRTDRYVKSYFRMSVKKDTLIYLRMSSRQGKQGRRRPSFIYLLLL